MLNGFSHRKDIDTTERGFEAILASVYIRSTFRDLPKKLNFSVEKDQVQGNGLSSQLLESLSRTGEKSLHCAEVQGTKQVGIQDNIPFNRALEARIPGLWWNPLGKKRSSLF